MMKILKISARNLVRYRRRTIMTAMLITVGIVVVLVFTSLADSFKSIMVGQITDSMLGHIQIHRKGYVASIDNLPLNLNLNQKAMEKVSHALDAMPEVETWSPRIQLGGMFSNFVETTNVRLNGIDPEKEFKTVPLLPARITAPDRSGPLLRRGEILVPELIAKGMKVKPGQDVVIIATNKDGSVNALTFKVRGIVGQSHGPRGRDGYIHIDDAASLLRMNKPEVSEVAVRLKRFKDVDRVAGALNAAFAGEKTPEGKPKFEVHTWDVLTPFGNILKIISVLNLSVKIILVAIVLISIMNVMIMAVYERIREIGTIAAIGTTPGKIMSLFMTEGLLLGVFGAVIGNIASAAIIFTLNAMKLSMSFGQMEHIPLAPALNPSGMAAVSAIVILIAVLASLQPAWKASRMEPVKALGHV
jgi:putative ABC transport system permease protein